LQGATAIGRVTVEVLRMDDANQPLIRPALLNEHGF
jgi:hypothetical protein